MSIRIPTPPESAAQKASKRAVPWQHNNATQTFFNASLRSGALVVFAVHIAEKFASHQKFVLQQWAR